MIRAKSAWSAAAAAPNQPSVRFLLGPFPAGALERVDIHNVSVPGAFSAAVTVSARSTPLADDGKPFTGGGESLASLPTFNAAGFVPPAGSVVVSFPEFTTECVSLAFWEQLKAGSYVSVVVASSANQDLALTVAVVVRPSLVVKKGA